MGLPNVKIEQKVHEITNCLDSLFVQHYDLNYLYTPISKIYSTKFIKYGNTIDATLYKSIRCTYKNPARTFTRKNRPRREARSLVRSRDNLYRLCSANAQYFKSSRPIFCTLKYARNEQSLSTTYADFKYFIKKLRHHTRRKIEYVAIPEIQKKRLARTGYAVWHLHVIFFNCPWVNVLEVEKIWGHGAHNQGVDWQVAKNLKAVSSYLLKYMNKSRDEVRLRGERSQLTSRGLIRPEISFDHRALDNLLQRHDYTLSDSYMNAKALYIKIKLQNEK